MRNVHLEVGQISTPIFLSLVVRAINEVECYMGGDEKARNLIRDDEFFIDVISAKEVNVCYIYNSDAITRAELIRIILQDEYICIQGEWGVKYHKYLSIDDRKNYEALCDEQLNSSARLLETHIADEIKMLKHHYDIVNTYPYGFNKVTCINNTTGTIEDIRLSPYYNVLNKNKQAIYNTIERGQEHGIVHVEEYGYCSAKAHDRHGLGAMYRLSSTYLSMLTSTEHLMWIPVCSLDQSTKLPFNKFVCLKSKGQESDSAIVIYLSSKGILYNNNVIQSTPTFPNPIEFETSQNVAVKYQTNNTMYVVKMLETGEISIEQTDTDNNKTTNIYNVEEIVERGEISNHSDLQPFSYKISILTEGQIYDGSQFEPIISTNTKNRLREEEQEKKNRQEHPILYFLISNWKIVVGVIIFLLLMLIMD